jgi:hypothetical protein
MAGYDTANPPALIAQGIGGVTGARIWFHKSATDVAATVDAAGYFSNGVSLGMVVNDIVLHTDYSTAATPLVTTHVVQSVSGDAVNVSLGTTVGSTTTGD